MNTLPETNSSPLKNGGWKTILSYWVSVTFQGRAVKLRGGITLLEGTNTANVFCKLEGAICQGIHCFGDELMPKCMVILSDLALRPCIVCVGVI